MGKEVLIPQGTYRVGRDIPAGVYIITALNKLSYITIADDYDEREWYTLDEEHGNSCHFEVKKGDILKIEGKVKIKRISNFISGDNDYGAHDKSKDNDSIYVAKTLADQWNINLNRFYNDTPSRLQRGMDYMQRGKVQTIVINKGIILRLRFRAHVMKHITLPFVSTRQRATDGIDCRQRNRYLLNAIVPMK